ncbi:MAG: flagellin [Alphaproteobacteria bacterium]
MVGIVTDTGNLYAQAAVRTAGQDKEEAMRRLSTGKQLNSASDDAAGVSIASRHTLNIVALRKAMDNAADAQNLLATAEGGMVEIENILQRVRELIVQGANDTLSPDDRSKVKLEIDLLIEEIDRIAETTTWAGEVLFNGVRPAGELATTIGEVKNLNFHIGAMSNAANTVGIDLKALTSQALGIKAGVIIPEMTGSATDVAPLANSYVVNNATATSATLEINYSFNAGDTYSFKINGHTVSITADADDGYANNMAGLNAQMVDEINRISGAQFDGNNNFTQSDLGFYATLSNTGKVAISYPAPVVGDVTDSNTPATFSVTNQTLTQSTVGNSASLNINGTSVTLPAVASPFSNDAAGWSAQAVQKIEDAGVSGLTFDTTTAGSVTLTSNLVVSDLVTTAQVGDDVGLQIQGSKVSVIGAASVGDSFSLVIPTEAIPNGKTIAVTLGATDGTTAAEIASLIKAEISTAMTNDTNFVVEVVDNQDGSLTIVEATSNGIVVDSNSTANASLVKVENALSTLAEARAELGAMVNRMGSAIENLSSIAVNSELSLGRIVDADYAVEMAKFTTAQILEQAAMAMMAQANASKQQVMTLLQG